LNEPPSQCDLAVVGAGILGLAVARELVERRPGAGVVVLEREDEVGVHQTGHNSGVIHAGIYYAPGSLKAKLCVEGASALYEFCERHGVPHERCGKVIVARDESELPALEELERRGRANAVPGLRRVGAGELLELEPHAAGVGALHSPATGIVDFPAVARALAEQVREAGGAVVTGCAVEGVREGGRGVRLRHALGETAARRAVFCAGAWADRLAVAAGAPADPRIVPFRGAYLKLKPGRRELVRSMIYPVPDPRLPFLGVHLTRHVDGEVLVGPTALLAGATPRCATPRAGAPSCARRRPTCRSCGAATWSRPSPGCAPRPWGATAGLWTTSCSRRPAPHCTCATPPPPRPRRRSRSPAWSPTAPRRRLTSLRFA
jgi:L-2-hydroxyglutarate oxidase